MENLLSGVVNRADDFLIDTPALIVDLKDHRSSVELILNGKSCNDNENHARWR